jgi:hypothetical protein
MNWFVQSLFTGIWQMDKVTFSAMFGVPLKYYTNVNMSTTSTQRPVLSTGSV